MMGVERLPDFPIFHRFYQYPIPANPNFFVPLIAFRKSAPPQLNGYIKVMDKTVRTIHIKNITK